MPLILLGFVVEFAKKKGWMTILLSPMVISTIHMPPRTEHATRTILGDLARLDQSLAVTANTSGDVSAMPSTLTILEIPCRSDLSLDLLRSMLYVRDSVTTPRTRRLLDRTARCITSPLHRIGASVDRQGMISR